jgi:DNA-directed RNA polymerase specialized sigma24 family protein
MENVLRQAKITGWQAWTWEAAERGDYAEIYDVSRQRIYALAYWMTGSEMKAEAITSNVFRRAFVASCSLDDELLDKVLVSEVRDLTPIGVLTLEQPVAEDVARIRGNVKKTDLEQAVMQLPATERLIFLLHDVERYDHARIARIVNITQPESQLGLHAARLRLRQLLAALV